MYECDECNATLEEGDEAFYFSDGSDEYIFCCEVCGQISCVRLSPLEMTKTSMKKMGLIMKLISDYFNVKE